MALAGGVQFYIDAQTLAFNRKMAAANTQMQTLGVTAGAVSKKTVAATTAMTTGAARLEKAFLRVRTVMVSVGVSLATIAGLAAIAKLITAASEFETAFAGVQKTVDATAEELAGLRAEIRQMAKEIPLTTTELSKIGEVGGQLGISVQNMGRFINVIAKLGVATTMSIDDAAMSVARFAAIMRTSEEDYERLASTLVHLGNNFAATEQEIMTMSLRIAGAGKQVGMTEDQVLSLATALTAVGIRAEAGGTAISRTMIEIDKQVAIAGDKLSQFAKVAGLGVTAFAQLWKKDAMAALQLFIEGLSKLEARGGNASIVLQELGLGAVRVSDTLRRASSAHELLNKTLKFGAEGWRENIALQREADIRFQTTASQFKMLVSRINDIAISIGEELLPTMLGLARVFVRIIEVTKVWSFALDALVVGGFAWMVKVGLPAMWAWFIKLTTAIRFSSTHIIFQNKLYASRTMLANARILQMQAEIAQTAALTRFTVAQAMAQTGDTVAARTAIVAKAQLKAANIAVAESTAALTAATKASTSATITWSAALKTILPLLIIFIAYSVGKYLREQAKALGEWQLAQQKVATQVAELSAKVIKQKEALGGVGDLVKDAGEKYQGASVGMQAFYAASKIPPSYLKDSEEASRQTAEDLEKIKDELEALEKALNSGIGSFENYYKILKAAKDPGRSVKDLIGKMVLSFRDAERAGTSYNTSVGQNIQSIKDLLFWAGYFDVEGDAFAEVLKKWVKEFDLARYAAENLGDILAKLDEDQQKFYLSMNASLHPLKKYSDELAEIKEINKAYGAEIINVTAWLKLNAKSIVDATQKQRELGTVLSKSDLELEALAKTFVGAEGAINKYVDAFKKAINPTVELGKKLKALLDNGEDVNVVVRLYAKEIVEATDTARKWDREINELVGSLEAQARATIPPTHELQKLDFQTISTAESQADFLEIVKRLPPPVEDLAVAINVLGKEFGKAKSPIEALSESLEKNWRQQLGQLTILPEAVAGQIDKMSAAGLNASQIMHLFGGSIKEAAEWLVLLDRPLTEAEQDIVDLAAAATDTSKIIQKQISTIITDLGKGFADIIVEWKGLWTSLKDIAKDFAKGILRIFFESLFTPIMKGFANVMGGVQGGFMGGFQGAGGFGGISGIFKALGGLFTGGGGGGGTAGFGGFTDAAEGMTMMDTAATSSSLSLTALTTNFKELGATIAGAAGTMWQFLTAGIAGGPWGLVIAGAAAAAVILWKTVFSKSAYEKFAQEFARDFGDIVISDKAVKNFANSLGVTEEQLAKVRKDVASSPAFLMIGYNAAVAQGKVDQFLKSLESIETAWGTFDFRAAFEEGIATGNWLDLNDAFVEAFGTDLLKEIFGEDLKGLLIEMDAEMIALVLRTRELQAALETLRDEPVRVAAALDTMTSSIQILRDAGATDAEIMKILGQDLELVAGAANELGIAIPPVIQELLALDIATSGLSEAFQKGYAIWGDMIQQGQDLSDTIMGVGARMLEVFAPGTIIAGEAIPSIEGLSNAFEALDAAARTGIGSIPDLMENVRIEAEKLKAIVPDSVGVLIDAFITQAEATATAGLALQEFEGVANTMKGMFGGIADDMIDGLIQQVRYLGTSEQAWLDVGTSLDKLKDKVPEAMHPMIEALRAWAASVHLANVELDGIDAAIQAAFGGDSVDIIRDAAGIAEAQLMTWRILGDDVLTMANNYHILGMELPPVIQLVLDWAIANKHAMESTEGHYIAIGKLSAAYAEGVGIWQNFIDKGWALQDKLMGLGDELLKEYDIVTAQRMAWMFLGDEVISMANAYERAGRTLPPVVQMALEWAAAAELIERNTEGAWVAVEGLTDALEGLNEQQVKGLDAWNDTLTATQDLADFIDGWQMGAITTLGIDVSDAEQVAKLGLLSWNKFGDQIISKANEMIDSGLGEFVDENILKWLDWAKAMGFVTQTADGMWKAIEGPGSDAAKPYWLQNWAAEMDAIYGAEWRNWSQYKNEWGGTSPGTMGGDIPEFPLPDDAIDSFADRVDGIGGISRRSAEDVGRLTEAIDLLGERAGVISRRAFDAGNGINTLDEVIRRTGISARRAAEDIEQARVSLSRFAISRREEAERAVGRRTGDGSSMVSAGNGGSSGNGYIPNDLGWIPPEGWWEGSGLPVAHSGMDYVPQDMVMMLQKGERVVPASENKAGGYKSSGVNVNIVIQGPVYGLDDLDRKIANSVRKTFKAGGLSFLGDS